MKKFEMPSSSALNREHMSVAFAIDVSSSVSDQALRNIQSCLNRFKGIVCADERAARCVDVAVVTFGNDTNVVLDWCPVMDMPGIELQRSSLTDLNGGVLKAATMIREQSRRYNEAGIVEKKPYLIVMTDGMDTVTDNVDEAANYVVPRERDGKLKLFFLGVDCYDRATAAQLTEGAGSMVFEIHDDKYDFSDFFDFAANSTKAASVSAVGEAIQVATPIATGESKIEAVNLSDWLNN